MKLFWMIRRWWKRNVRFVQCCERCGDGMGWWGDPAIWMHVVGRPWGCFCIECFDWLAKQKQIILVWEPTVDDKARILHRDANRLHGPGAGV